MSDLRKAAQHALEAIDYLDDHPEGGIDEAEAAIEALRDALAQPEQEPVAWRCLEDPFGANEYLITDDPEKAKGPGWTPLYAHPRQRKPLTPEKILALLDSHNVYGSKWVEFARAIEKAHGIGGEA